MNSYKIHIHNQNIDLLYDDAYDIGRRITEVREVRVLTPDDVFIMMFDERFNELNFIYDENSIDPLNYINQSTEYLKEKFKELKSTDFRYKSGHGYEGSKILYLEDFITYLKSENRETIINKLLENE